MLRLLIFAVFMLLMSAICNGQGKTSFGDNSPTDTSFTVAQLKLNAYSGGADTMILIVLPNGTVKKVDKGAFSGGGSTLQQVLAAGDSSHGNAIKIALDSPGSDHIKLFGGAYTSILFTNNQNKQFSLGVGGNGTLLEDRFFVYDNTNNLAPFVIDDDGHVHMGGFADVSPGLSVESNLGFSPLVTARGKVKLVNTPVRSNFNDSTLGIRSGDTVTVMPPLQPVLDAKEPTITAATTADYYRGDKTFQPVLSLPVSTATQAALDLKLNTTSVSNGSIQYSSAKTVTIPTQSAAERLINLRAATSIGSPVVWLIADSLGTVTTGGAIDTLKDLSGNANHFYQITSANKATFVSSGGMNGLSYASFSDDASFPSKYNSATITLDTNLSFFIVFRSNNITPSVGTFLLGSSSNACMQLGSTGGISFNNSGPQVGGFRGGTSNYMIVEMNRRGRVQNYFMYGVELPRTSANVTTGTFNFSGLGNTFAATNQYVNMNFHELVAYNSRLTNEQLLNVRNYLFAKYGVKSGALFSVGDSWVAGTVASGTAQQRWSTLLSNYLGYGEINQGIPGTILESTASPEANNLYDRKQWMPKAPIGKDGYAVIMIGGNDVTRNAATHTPALYKYQLSTVVNTLLSKGWQRNQIIISNQGRFSSTTRARWDSFANNALAVAREMNLMSADLNTYFGDNIANNGEGTHPTVTQSDTIAKFIHNVISTGWTQDTVVLTSASTFLPIPNALPYVFTGTTSTWTLPPVIGNSPYQIRIKNRGSGAITLNSNAGGNDIFTTAAASTLSVTSGMGVVLQNDGTYWNVVYDY